MRGKLGDVTAWRRLVAEAAGDPRTGALLAALSRVARVAAKTVYGPADANELAGIAEAILGADVTLSDVARPFAQAGAAIAAGRTPREVAALIDAASVRLSATARNGLSAATRSADPSLARLSGAVADALKRGGRQ